MRALLLAVTAAAAFGGGPAAPGEPVRIDALLARLWSEDLETRTQATEAIASLREEALPHLFRALNGDRWRGRGATQRAFVKIGSAAVPFLVTACRDQQPGVRLNAVWLLGELGPVAGSATAALVRTLGDPDAGVRSESALSLMRLGPAARGAGLPLVAALSDADPYVRASAAAALREVGGEPAAAVPALCRNVHDPGVDVRLRTVEALAAYAAESDEALRGVVGAMRDDDSLVRKHAILGLANVSAKRPDDGMMMAAFLGALGDDDETCRWYAALALGKQGQRAVPELSRLIADRRDPAEQLGANRSGRLPPQASAAVQALAYVHAKSPPGSDARRSVEEALRTIGPSALPPLILCGRFPGTVDSANLVVTVYGRAAIPVLCEMLQGEDWACACRVLVAYGGEARVAIPALEKIIETDPGRRAAVEHVLTELRAAADVPAGAGRE